MPTITEIITNTEYFLHIYQSLVTGAKWTHVMDFDDMRKKHTCRFTRNPRWSASSPMPDSIGKYGPGGRQRDYLNPAPNSCPPQKKLNRWYHLIVFSAAHWRSRVWGEGKRLSRPMINCPVTVGCLERVQIKVGVPSRRLRKELRVTDKNRIRLSHLLANWFPVHKLKQFSNCARNIHCCIYNQKSIRHMLYLVYLHRPVPCEVCSAVMEARERGANIETGNAAGSSRSQFPVFGVKCRANVRTVGTVESVSSAQGLV